LSLAPILRTFDLGSPDERSEIRDGICTTPSLRYYNLTLPGPYPMPRFAANLAYLFTERPLIERFAAAAAAGFKAVELQLPYGHAPSAVKAELDRHGLTMLGINTAPGQSAAGEFGVAAVPGRDRELATLFKQAVEHRPA